MLKYTKAIAEEDFANAYQMTTEYMEQFSSTTVLKICEHAFAQLTDPNLAITTAYGSIGLYLNISLPMLHCIRTATLPVIISASPQAVVEAFVELYQIHHAIIIASKGELSQLPYREQKVELAKERGIDAPWVAFGNSIGDREMLDWAERAVFRTTEASAELIQMAKESGWELLNK